MITWSEILIRLSLGALLGGIVGLERERKDWAAGLRTHMMVCVGATLSMMVSSYGFNDVLSNQHVSFDPSRVAAQVISGIGFIGAGTILFLRQQVIRGLTTASGLWTVAAIGLATGGGMYFAASAATLAVIIILAIIKPVEKRFFKRFKNHQFDITVTDSSGLMASVQEVFVLNSAEITALTITKHNEDTSLQVKFTNIADSGKIMELMNQLRKINGLKELSWDKNSTPS